VKREKESVRMDVMDWMDGMDGMDGMDKEKNL
jgi:hypothetical protein